MSSLQRNDPFVLCDTCRRHCTHSNLRGLSPSTVLFDRLVGSAKWCDSCSIILEGIRRLFEIEDEDEDEDIDSIDISSNGRFGSIEVSAYQGTILFHARGDVGYDPSGKIFLQEQVNQKSRYLCLSYCWGGADFLRTARETFDAHKQEIPWEMLPRTFQDAIEVTRALGVRYIWIDALCIVQDDHQDWEREAGEMATIYHNSFLTITAAAAESPEAGLFSINSSLTLDSTIIQLVCHFPNSPTVDFPTRFPLLTRAWTYQERMLAPRVLHFGREEVSWECSEELQCECGSKTDHFRDEVSKRDFFDVITRSISDDYRSPEQMWRKIVVEYSPLALTVPSDKLPALSGLAEKMRYSTNQTYLAGLWKETLALDLLWYIESSYSSTPRGAHLPEVWRAPSWSWASIDGPIMYDQTLYAGLSYMEHKKINVFIKVLNAECTPKGCSVTGEVAGGYLLLAASILPVSYYGGSSPGVPYREPNLILQNKDITFQSDHRTELGSVDLYVVRIAQLPPTKWTYDVCLVVIPVDASRDKFMRVGLATLHSPNDDVNSLVWPERTEITII